jgi:GntR family transcriptional regulator
MSAALSHTDERLPLYARLRDALAARIAALEWPSGSVIPTEPELAKFYGVSTHTLRKAVEQLVREGLLERRQGSGTYVRRPSFDGSLFRWFNFEDAAHAGERPGPTVPESRLLRRHVAAAPAEVAAKLGLAAGAELVQVLRLRLWAGEPLITEDLYLPLPRFRRFLDLDEAEIGPLLYPVYEREFGALVASVEDELWLGRADALRAELLQVEEGAPIIMVDRTSAGLDGRPLEWRRAYGRGDRFRYKVKLR